MLRTAMILLTLALLSAPALSHDESGQTLTVTDEEGREVTLPAIPKKIISLTPAAAEVIYALGEADRLAAVSEDCISPPALMAMEKVGESGREVDLERVMEIGPDLVIAKTGGLFSAEDEERLKGYGVPVLRYRGLQIDTLIPMIADLGLILGREEEARELIGWARGYSDLVSARTAGIPEEERPRIYFMSMGHFDWTAGFESAGHERIVEAGGENIAEDLPGKVPHVDMEWVLERDPEVIVYSIPTSQYAGPTPNLQEMADKRAEIMSLPAFDQIDAVETGRVYVADINMASGLSEVVMILYYAKWFHPDLFTDIDPRAVSEEVYRRFFGMEINAVHQVYPETAIL
jgi:iron complex transport system substrate-binding protein